MSPSWDLFGHLVERIAVPSPPYGMLSGSPRPALNHPFRLLFVCGSFSQYLPIPNTPITLTHEVPVHGGFRSGELQGCLSGLSKSSPASPFLCGRQPSGQRYFPECPHCTTGGIAPQFCFLSEIQRHRGLRGWEGASRKVLGHWCPGAPLLCSQWHGLSITLWPPA